MKTCLELHRADTGGDEPKGTQSQTLVRWKPAESSALSRTLVAVNLTNAESGQEETVYTCPACDETATATTTPCPKCEECKQKYGGMLMLSVAVNILFFMGVIGGGVYAADQNFRGRHGGEEN